MRTKISLLMCMCISSIGTVMADDTIIDFQAVHARVNSLQHVTIGLPSGVSEPKGRIGFIISKLFDTNGKIGNRFLKALGTRGNNRILKWSGNDSGQLINSSITDNGSTVGITGDLAVSGHISTTAPTANNHAVTKAYVDAAVSASSGLWSSNGNKAYYNSGNVGIGTNNPSQKLDVAGNLKLDNGTYGELYFGPTGHQRLLGDNNAYLYHDSNNDDVSGMIFRDKQYDTYGYVYGSQGDHFGLLDGDGSWSYLTHKDDYTQLRINDIGRMHLDTDSMYLRGEQLQVGWNRTGNRYAYLDLVGDDTYTDYGLRILRANGGANTHSEITHRGTGPLYIRTWDAGDLHFGTNATNRMTIQKNTGNVGIGTGNPGARLAIMNNTGGALALPNGGGVGTYGAPVGKHPLRLYEAWGWNFTLQNSTNSGFRVKSTDETETFLNVQGSTGNVGIGTANPIASARLDVRGGNISTDRYLSVRPWTSDTATYGTGEGKMWYRGTGGTSGAGQNMLHIDGGTGLSIEGNVGLGTTNPTTSFDVRKYTRLDTPDSTRDVWIQGGAGGGSNRNLALLGADEDSGDWLWLNYNNEYSGGTRISDIWIKSTQIDNVTCIGNCF